MPCLHTVTKSSPFCLPQDSPAPQMALPGIALLGVGGYAPSIPIGFNHTRF